MTPSCHTKQDCIILEGKHSCCSPLSWRARSLKADQSWTGLRIRTGGTKQRRVSIFKEIAWMLRRCICSTTPISSRPTSPRSILVRTWKLLLMFQLSCFDRAYRPPCWAPKADGRVELTSFRNAPADKRRRPYSNINARHCTFVRVLPTYEFLPYCRRGIPVHAP